MKENDLFTDFLKALCLVYAEEKIILFKNKDKND